MQYEVLKDVRDTLRATSDGPQEFRAKNSVMVTDDEGKKTWFPVFIEQEDGKIGGKAYMICPRTGHAVAVWSFVQAAPDIGGVFLRDFSEAVNRFIRKNWTKYQQQIANMPNIHEAKEKSE